jgi:phosphomannomutase
MADSRPQSAADGSELPPLRFGTDGWRGIIADTFTLANLDRIAQATARALRSTDVTPRVVIGHDRRFMASTHADRVAEVLVANGFSVLRTSSDLPTPALSGLVVDHEAALGLMLTASHNTADFGGYKVKSARGGSAAPQFTRLIESHLDREAPRRLAAAEARQRGMWHPVDFRPAYLARLGRRVDQAVLKASPRLTVVVDSMHGCGGDLIADFLADCGHRVITLHGSRDVLFGGQGPEPVQDRLTGLREAVLAERADLGIANDGDADRVAAVDEKGQFLSALQITPLLAQDRLVRCGETGGIARTCANTILLDRIAKAHDLPFHVHPIGFKHLVPSLERGDLLIGGEESGGIGVSNYLPERDGILIGLLMVEMRAARGLPVSLLLKELWETYGEFHYRRRDLRIPPARAHTIVSGLEQNPPDNLAGLAVTGTENLDGIKLLLGEDGWIMARPSGTEPVLRLYCEARTPELVEELLQSLGRHLDL